MRTIRDRSLYLVITEEFAAGRTACEIAERACAGGVDIVQMREKYKPVHELAELGTKLAAICRKAGALFIVNDDPMLALRVGADGVHLGQEDAGRFPIEQARDALGPGRLIGLSASSREEFEKANSADIDYIGYGPIFPTKLKDNHVGTGDIEYVMGGARRPVFFIGGIQLTNIDDILRRGGRNVALVRGITESPDIEASARQFKTKLSGREPLKVNKAKG